VERLLRRARRFYGPHLRSGEQIEDVVVGYATGTATRVVQGMIFGGFVGWFSAILLDAAPLPMIVLGGCAGIVAGFFISERAAGTGATDFLVALTNTRLLIARRSLSGRLRILRSCEITAIREATTHRYPIGHLCRQLIVMSDGTTVEFAAMRELRLEPVNRNPTSG
jgi:hypothetical protein